MDWLREKRLSKKLTQAEVANQAGIQRSFYTLIETGARRPSVENAKAISAVLDFDWTKFYDEAPQKQANPCE